jgi:hypothetical protein
MARLDYYRVCPVCGSPAQRGQEKPVPCDPIIEVDVDGLVNEGVEYWGKATRYTDGTWRALANVGGALCLVECTIKMPMPFVWEGENA